MSPARPTIAAPASASDSSPAEAAEHAEVVLTMLADGDIAREANDAQSHLNVG